MDVVEVEGEPISPEECTRDHGWYEYHRKTKITDFAGRGSQGGDVSRAAGAKHFREGRKAPRQPRRKGPKEPELPRDDIKIIMRPRNGLDLRKCSPAEILNGVRRAAGMEASQAEDDVDMGRAGKYRTVQRIQLRDRIHEISTYVAPPEGSAKGVIHNVPREATKQDILDSLIQRRNPSILSARRLGTTNSVLIIFEDEKVPYHVYYQGAEYRCYLHKKKHEVCGNCGAFGHRGDVCPMEEGTPPKVCPKCGLKTPTSDHPCEPRCAMCGKDHETGDKKCRQRYRTPYLVQKRRWNKERQARERQRSQSDDRQRPRTRSLSFPRLPQATQAQGNQVQTPASARQRSQSRGRARTRTTESRSPKQTPRTPSRDQGRKRHQTPEKVSWATAASQPNKDSHSQLKSEMALLKQMMDRLRKENLELKSRLERMQSEGPDAQTSAGGTRKRKAEEPEVEEDPTKGINVAIIKETVKETLKELMTEIVGACKTAIMEELDHRGMLNTRYMTQGMYAEIGQGPLPQAGGPIRNPKPYGRPSGDARHALQDRPDLTPPPPNHG